MSEELSVLPGEDLEKVLRRASGYLAAAGVESALADAQLLAAFAWERTAGEQVSRGRVQALALMGTQVSEDFAALYERLVRERGRRIPLQHLTGRAYFRSLELAVGPGVFVPRPETEELVSRVLERVSAVRTAEKTQRRLKIADLCTGSAAIAASLAEEASEVEVSAIELSELAYAWASKNLEGRGVRLVLGDARTAFEGEEGTFDIVAANPPYIPQQAIPKDPEVRDHDPDLALYGGSDDGLLIPSQITTRAYSLLAPGGFFICEHAETQGEAMRQVLQLAGFIEIESIRDLTGRPRHTAGIKPKEVRQ